MMTVRTAAKRWARSAALAALGVRSRLADRRAVLLTFDDGPEPGVTEAILDRLARHSARGVFFSVGYQVARSGHLLPQVRGAGHRLGNHSYEHPAELPKETSVVLDDLRRCQSIVESHAGLSPTLYRPPLGTLRWSNVSASRRLALTTVLWSVDSRDWQLSSREEAEERGAALATTVEGGDIVLLHEHNEHVITVLDRLLPALVDRGFDLRRGVDLL